MSHAPYTWCVVWEEGGGGIAALLTWVVLNPTQDLTFVRTAPMHEGRGAAS